MVFMADVIPYARCGETFCFERKPVAHGAISKENGWK